MSKYDIKVNTNPVANAYASRGEHIVEYSNNQGQGGLISFREGDDGQVIVELYRHDENVLIRVGEAS